MLPISRRYRFTHPPRRSRGFLKMLSARYAMEAGFTRAGSKQLPNLPDECWADFGPSLEQQLEWSISYVQTRKDKNDAR